MILLWFSIVFSQKIPAPSLAAFPPFYSVILKSQGTIDSPVLLPGHQSLFCAYHPEGWAFPYFSYFPPFDAVSLKAHGWLSIPGCTHSSKPLMIQFFWSFFFFVIFPKWAESISAGSKVFAATSLFISSHSSSPRYRSLALWMVTLRSLHFLLPLVPRKDVPPPPFVSCVSFGVFLWAVSILLLTGLYVLGISNLYQSPGIPTQLLAPVIQFFWQTGSFFFFYSSFFPHRL